MGKGKTYKEGESCNNKYCSGALVKSTPSRKFKFEQTYYYEYIHKCTGCNRIFSEERAKRFVKDYIPPEPPADNQTSLFG